MPSTSEIQALLDARSKGYGVGFDQLNVDAVMAWHSSATVFNDLATNEFNMRHSDVRKLFARMFPMMRQMRIIESKTTGSLTHCAWEMLLELEYRVDEPIMGITAGQKAFVRGVAVQEWEWQDEDGAWNGSLAEDAIKGWKIVKENDYMITLKADSEGSKIGMLE